MLWKLDTFYVKIYIDFGFPQRRLRLDFCQGGELRIKALIALEFLGYIGVAAILFGPGAILWIVVAIYVLAQIVISLMSQSWHPWPWIVRDYRQSQQSTEKESR